MSFGQAVVVSRERLGLGCSAVKVKANVVQAAVLSNERVSSGCSVVKRKVNFRM